MNFVTSTIRWVLKGNSGTAATLQTLLVKVSILGINMATGIITARVLGPQGRGEQAALVLWPQFLSSAMTLGLPSSLVYNFRLHPKEKSELFSTAILIGIVLSLIVVLVGIVFMPWWLAKYSPEVIYLAQWFMLNAPLCLLLLIGAAALEAEGEFTSSNQVRFLIPLIALVALSVLALTGLLTPFTSSLAYTVNGIPIYIWIVNRLKHLFRLPWDNLVVSCKRLINYGLRSYGIDLIGTLALQVDQVLVVGLLTPASMGTYVVALSLSRMLNVFQSSIVTVLFPKAAARPIAEVVSLTGRAMRVSTMLSLLAGIAVMLLGPILLRLLYGSEYLGAVAVFRILLIEVILAGAAMVLAQAFMAVGRPGTVTILQGIGLGISVPLMLLLIPKYGLVGAGLSLLCSTTARLAFILACYPLMLKVRPPALFITQEDLYFLKQNFLL